MGGSLTQEVIMSNNWLNEFRHLEHARVRLFTSLGNTSMATTSAQADETGNVNADLIALVS
jgi:hypothetical protein